ncbi:hypothetical protein HHI36_008122 [Cryptolaemus montrouzieri]|uniref:Uncharacterized protein n=1 Tax=Cryptolaemus montrouzieri TaxID=559131 RepID=A0ABD2MRM5_9CUCU
MTNLILLRIRSKEVIGLIDQFNDDIKSSLYRKITSKIAHIVERVDRAHPTEDTKLEERSQLSSEALTLLPKLTKCDRTFAYSKLSILDASLLNIRVDSDDDLSFDGSDEENEGAIGNSTPKPAGVNKGQSSTGFQVKSVPVTKWNLQFSGDSKNMSVSACLERVEELSCSRHIT